MDENRIRRIVREEIAMTLVTIVRRADVMYDPISDSDAHNAALAMIRTVVNSVADDMVRELARTSQAGGS